MEVFVGAGCLADYDRYLTPQLPAIISSLCRTLSKRQVARAFMHHVRIGETVALVDRKMGCSFRLKMGHIRCASLGSIPPQHRLKMPLRSTISSMTCCCSVMTTEWRWLREGTLDSLAGNCDCSERRKCQNPIQGYKGYSSGSQIRAGDTVGRRCRLPGDSCPIDGRGSRPMR